MASDDGLRGLWRRVLAALRRLLGARPSVPALPSPRDDLPAAGTTDFLGAVLWGGAVSDARTDAWLRQVRAELPFPQPRYGAAVAPSSARDLVDQMTALDAEVRAAASRAPRPAGGMEPDWFVLFADRFLPLAAWFAGVGMAEAVAPPDWLRELAQRVRRVPGAGRTLDWLDERIARLSEHNAGTLTAYFALLKLHLEASLDASQGAEGAEVLFDFPASGARIADLDPPPPPGSPTSGVVARVLCPAVTVRFPATENGPAVVLARGAHVRA